MPLHIMKTIVNSFVGALKLFSDTPCITSIKTLTPDLQRIERMDMRRMEANEDYYECRLLVAVTCGATVR